MLMKEEKWIGRNTKMLKTTTTKNQKNSAELQHIFRTAEVMRSLSRSYMKKLMWKHVQETSTFLQFNGI